MTVSRTFTVVEGVLARASGAGGAGVDDPGHGPVVRVCFNCAYYSDGMQTCNRHAPRPGQFFGEDERTQWPQVDRADFCGEFAQSADVPDGGWADLWDPRLGFE